MSEFIDYQKKYKSFLELAKKLPINQQDSIVYTLTKGCLKNSDFVYSEKNQKELAFLLCDLLFAEQKFEAFDIIKDKFGEKDTFKSCIITQYALDNPTLLPHSIYSALCKNIIKNKDLGEIVINGAANGGDSFLLNVVATDLYLLNEEEKNTIINICCNRPGSKKYNEYINNYDFKNIMLLQLSSALAHGIYHYDIRYHALRNKSFNIEEKRKIIFEGYQTNKSWNSFLTKIQIDLFSFINDYCDMKDVPIDFFEDTNDEITKELKNEFKFLNFLKKIRPMDYNIID